MYTTNAKVLQVLGPFVDTTDDLTTAQVDVYISQVGGWIMDRLGAVYSPFNQESDTPATPETIALICRHWSIAESLRQLVGVNNQAAADLADRHQAIADALLQNVMDAPDRAIAPEYKADETITWGTGSPSWALQTHQAFIADTTPITASGSFPPNILPSSFRFTAGTWSGHTLADIQAMRYGYEWKLDYSPQYRKWVLSAYEEALYDGSITGLKCSYEWDYRRVVGDEDADSADAAIIISQFQ